MNPTPKKVRQRAYSATARALREGVIKRKTECERCGVGSTGSVNSIIIHHPDYNDPLTVEFLCNSCHKRAHIEAGDVRDRWHGEVVKPKTNSASRCAALGLEGRNEMADKLRKLMEKKFFEAGGGMWFRNSDNGKIVVHVRFYPKTRLKLENGTPVTLEELQRNYHRLRV